MKPGRRLPGANTILDRPWIFLIMVNLAAAGIAFSITGLSGWAGAGPMIFIVAVIIISRYTGKYRYGVVSSFICSALVAFFFGPSNISIASYVSALALMLSVTFFTGAVTLNLRKQTKRATDEENHSALLNDINQRLLKASGLETIYASIARCFYEFTGRPVVLYTLGINMEACAELSIPDGLIYFPGELAAAAEAFAANRPVGTGTGACTFSSFYYLPLVRDGIVFAAAALLYGPYLPSGGIPSDALALIAAQASMAIQRQSLIDEQQIIVLEREKERMRNSFLSAISHDLRSPLTGITSACSALKHAGESIDTTSRLQLINDIEEEAGWLLRMVENLLSVTRVEDGTARLIKTLEPVEEIIIEAVSRTQKRFSGLAINVSLPDEVIMLPVDATLIVQVLINLIENSARHAGGNGRIDILAREEGRHCAFVVKDYGQGINEKARRELFSVTSRKTGNSAQGLGIGLSICRSIVLAHGGEIEGFNHDLGGAEFRFTLPLEET